MTKRAKSSAFPEGAEYTDDGCEVAPKCLECPLPVCRYDVPPAPRNDARDAEIHRRRTEGELPEDLAAHFGLSRRRVYSILARPLPAVPGPAEIGGDS